MHLHARVSVPLCFHIGVCTRSSAYTVTFSHMATCGGEYEPEAGRERESDTALDAAEAGGARHETKKKMQSPNVSAYTYVNARAIHQSLGLAWGFIYMLLHGAADALAWDDVVVSLVCVICGSFWEFRSRIPVSFTGILACIALKWSSICSDPIFGVLVGGSTDVSLKANSSLEVG